MKIEELRWRDHIRGPLLQNERNLSQWFQRFVAPYEFYDPKDAVGVFGSLNDGTWAYGRNKIDVDTHRALLINIEPIKKDTAEDVLRDWLGNQDRSHEQWQKLRARAKAVLGEKGQ